MYLYYDQDNDDATAASVETWLASIMITSTWAQLSFTSNFKRIRKHNRRNDEKPSHRTRSDSKSYSSSHATHRDYYTNLHEPVNEAAVFSEILEDS